MTAGPLDTTKYNDMVNNAAARVKISSAIFKAFIGDVKEKVGDNYALSAAINQNVSINGNFGVNQRAKSGTVTLTAGQYGHDRWKAGASGCTYTFSTNSNVTTITITAGSLIQVIEGVNLFSGTYTLAWTGTAQGKIGAGAYGISGITGAATGGTNLNIEFNAGTLSKVQFNSGAVALPFQARSFAEELQLCQRYYEKSYSQNVSPASAASAGAMSVITQSASILGGFRFKTIKRVAPTITVYSPSGTQGKVWNSSDADISSGVIAIDVNDSGTRYMNSNGGLTAGGIHTFHFVADAEL